MFHRSAVPQPPTCVPLLPCSAVPPFHRLVRCLAPLRCMFRRSAVPSPCAMPCSTPLYVPPFRRSIALCDALLHSVVCSAVPPFHRLVRCLAPLRCMFRRSAVPEHHAVPCLTPLYVPPFRRSRASCSALPHSVVCSAIPPFQSIMQCLAPLRWNLIYVPVLPEAILELLEAPGSYVLGCHSRHAARVCQVSSDRLPVAVCRASA